MPSRSVLLIVSMPFFDTYTNSFLFSVCPSFTGSYALMKNNNTYLLNQNQNGIETFNGSQDKNCAKLKKYFVTLKSNSALLYNKGPNLLTSAFSPKNVKSIKFL